MKLYSVINSKVPVKLMILDFSRLCYSSFDGSKMLLVSEVERKTPTREPRINDVQFLTTGVVVRRDQREPFFCV